MTNKELFSKIATHIGKNSIMLVTKLGEKAEKFLYLDGRYDDSIIKDIGEYKNKIELLKLNGQKYFIEPINLEPNIYVCGGGYVAQAVVKLAKFLNYNVIAIEDRLQFINQLKSCGADEVIYDDFENATSKLDGGANCYFVILTRGHKFDMVCLKNIIDKKYAYLGMMSSHYRAENTKKMLTSLGYDNTKISTIHTPIGLEIGAYTPEEIAVSILAEITQEKSKNATRALYSKEVLQALANQNEEIVMATIIKRKGSTPCDIGTKMLFFKDGKSIGTIGGGCMEYEVKQKAMKMFDTCKNELVHIDMTGSFMNDDESMICGGINDIFLEYISS